MREGGNRRLDLLGVVAGLVAALAMLWVMLLIRVLTEVPSLPELLSEELIWRPEGAAEPLTINLVEFFAEALDRQV